MSGELENAGKRGPGGKEKEWTDCVADDLRLFGVTGDWKTAALDPGAWYNTVQEGVCRFMAAWVREEENASNQRQKKRDAEEADKVEVAPGVTVASLRRFRTALIGPTQSMRFENVSSLLQSPQVQPQPCPPLPLLSSSAVDWTHFLLRPPTRP